MLDPSQPISDLPGVTAYRDDRRHQRFYAYPAVPRLARDSNGAPAISLLLYGKKTNGVFQLTGGYLSLTTSFALSAREAEQLRVLVQERLRKEQKLAPDAPLTIELVAPDWTSGTVTVCLSASLELSGSPSLFSANEAALSLSLDAEQAHQLHGLWKEGLPSATIIYDLRTESAHQKTYTSEVNTYKSSTESGSSSTHSVQSNYKASLTQAIPFFVRAEGPLGLSAAELHAQAEEISL